MHRYVKNIVPIVKYVLSAFSMMDVPINNYYILFSLWHKIICCHSHIIEERKSMRLILHTAVMSWRSDQTNKILWAFLESVLNSQKNCFYSLKSSIKSLFHVISIDIDKHLRFWYALAPHAFNEIKIPLPMDFDNLLKSNLADFLMINLYSLFEF